MQKIGIYILVAIGVVGYNALTSADRDETGAIVDGGTVDAFDVRAGDCFDDTDSLEDITSLPAVPCSEPHDNEAYAVLNVSMENYPGDEAMGDHAFESCKARFEGFVGRDYESSELDIFTMYPSPESWKQNDRQVVCAIYNMDFSKLVGSAEGTAL